MTRIDDMVCFSLYAASRATTHAYRRVLQPWGLTYPQYLVLVSLWLEGAQSVRALGDTLALDSGTLSPLLRRLETAGFVSRTRRATDERVVDVDLTDRGRELGVEMREVPAKIATCMALDLESARTLVDSLHTLTRNMQPAEPADAIDSLEATASRPEGIR